MNFYIHKAISYDSLSSFFKYRNSNLYIFYYFKHLKYLQKAAKFTLHPKLITREYTKKAHVRILYTVPESLNVRILLNGREILTDASYKTLSHYFEVDDGHCHIEVIDSRSTTYLLDTKDILIHPENYHTLAIVKNSEGYKILDIPMQRNIPVEETKLRFVHLSPDSPTFDIAVKKGDVVFPEVKFEQTTDYLGLTPMSVELEARITGSKNIVLSFPSIILKPDQAYTLVAVGFVKEEPLLEVILLRD
ncbi:DUF4397 domain-containing protein [Bacillus sp. cl95]|uniref:DUF4397 domain-containing protein n=2 Tax=unclassified Bacillus (in: firmicutes) TaxID=185979 RepID=UPI0011135DDB|nr:DUF4397 domain-containing protein [Bacillus sp. cl95]